MYKRILVTFKNKEEFENITSWLEIRLNGASIKYQLERPHFIANWLDFGVAYIVNEWRICVAPESGDFSGITPGYIQYHYTESITLSSLLRQNGSAPCRDLDALIDAMGIGVYETVSTEVNGVKLYTTHNPYVAELKKVRTKEETALNTVSSTPTKVIFNPPATICYWPDGTKTVVKCHDNDLFSEEVGLAMCYMKKALGNKYEYYGRATKIIKHADRPKHSVNAQEDYNLWYV